MPSSEEVVKLKTEKDVLQITVKHLKSDLEKKAATIRSQNEELQILRDAVIKLKAQVKQKSPKRALSPGQPSSQRTLGATPGTG